MLECVQTGFQAAEAISTHVVGARRSGGAMTIAYTAQNRLVVKACSVAPNPSAERERERETLAGTLSPQLAGAAHGCKRIGCRLVLCQTTSAVS